MKKDFAPKDERFTAALARIKAMPKLIDQAMECLLSPPKVYVETAIMQNAGVIHFYKETVATMAEGNDPEQILQ